MAWQQGDGALANVALDRALAEDANYSMAVLLRQVIDSGAPPSLARLPMTPDEVAASYDALEASDEADARTATKQTSQRTMRSLDRPVWSIWRRALGRRRLRA